MTRKRLILALEEILSDLLIKTERLSDDELNALYDILLVLDDNPIEVLARYKRGLVVNEMD